MIAILGSANIDFVFRIKRFPRLGETMPAEDHVRVFGGKGANQAVACARLGAETFFMGSVGDDAFGEDLLNSLKQNGVQIEYVQRLKNVYSGTTVIFVDSEGNNSILYYPGANNYIDTTYIDFMLPHIIAASVLLVQFEIPLNVIAYLLERLPPNRPVVIVDPSPINDLRVLPTERIDLLTPNHIELTSLTGCSDIMAGSKQLLDLGVKQVICKVGEHGAWVISRKEIKHFPAFRVRVVDTTAAGDAFNAGLAVALEKGLTFDQAMILANAAGALACTKLGAQPSLPYWHELETFLRDHGITI
ncbi:MAG: ribokinase [Clostridia bacterium]|nr:ribokinase [Clostridia bacterium]